jgi:2-dehydro-3-deoxygluconokinase
LSAAEIETAAASGLFEGARWLHLSGITPALSAGAQAATGRAIDLARNAGSTISLDLNLRRRLWSDEISGPVLRELAARTDVILGSPDELAVVTNRGAGDDPADLARAVIALGPSVAVVKLGARGALAIDHHAPDVAVVRPGVPLPLVVDPIGAGDAFCAGFIDARLDGADLGSALEIGNACGAAVASALGDQTGLPDRAEITAILRGSTDTGAPDTIR